jgi:hypothetical protein
MGNPSFQVDIAPWDKLLSTSTTFDALGNATVTGSGTLLSKPFKINSKTSFSFFVQATGSPTISSGFIVQANNGYDDSRQVASPGVWTDVTADYGTAGAGTAPGVHRFKATFASPDYFSSWVCPYAFIRFQLVQASGTGVYSGQFYAGEV